MPNEITPDIFPLPTWFMTDHTIEQIVTQLPGSRAAVEKLVGLADKQLTKPCETVLNKKKTPPSGDKHDYMSLAIYTWPNPDTPDGLPYIHKDGLVNPEIHDYDLPRFFHMVNAVELCTLAALHTSDAKYAAKAVDVLNTWFINPATAMRPHLNFGQGVPGECDGRCYGIIETTSFIKIVNYVRMLEKLSGQLDDFCLDTKISEAMRSWMGEYADWLENSELGKLESQITSNHRVWHLAQLVSLLMFCGKTDKVKSLLEPVLTDILAQQMADDGSMPREVARTRSLHYSVFVLTPMYICAEIGQTMGINLLDIKTENGGSIRKGSDWLLPYLCGKAEWTAEQIIEENPYEDIYPTIRMMANVFNDSSIEAELKELVKDEYEDLLMNMVLPPKF